jgi:hypothetical protein
MKHVHLLFKGVGLAVVIAHQERYKAFGLKGIYFIQTPPPCLHTACPNYGEGEEKGDEAGY